MKFVLFLLVLGSSSAFADYVRNSNDRESKLFCAAIVANMEYHSIDAGIDADNCLKRVKRTHVQNSGKKIITGKVTILSHSEATWNVKCAVVYTGTPTMGNLVQSPANATTYCE